MTEGMVERVRRQLGPVGAFVGVGPDAPTARAQQASVRRLEAAGWAALWTNEIVGTDALVRAALWLAATERAVVGTCVANVWVRPAPTAHAAATQLEQAYPGRFVLGLGVGRPEQAVAVGRSFGSPSATAREFLEATAGAAYPRLLAANGPRMLELAATAADGALPAGAPPEATATTRTTLGAGALLVVYMPLSGSEPAAQVAETVQEHRSAGADHVIVGRRYDTDVTEALAHLEALGAALH